MIYVLRWVKTNNIGTALACRDKAEVIRKALELIELNIPFSMTIQEVI